MQLSRIVRSLAGGFFAEIVNKLVPLLILRYVVREIGIEGFGLAQFGYWLIDVAIAFVVFGYTSLAAIELGQNQGKPDEQARIISEVLGLKCLHAVLATACLLAFVWTVPSYTEYKTVVTALSFILLTSALDMSFVHIGTSRMLSLSVLTILVKLLSLGSILLWVKGPDDLLTFALLYFGANGVISASNFLLNVRRFRLVRPEAAALRRRFKASLPYAVTGCLSLALDRYDVFVVERFLGAAGSGLYGGPVRVAQALSNVIGSIGMVFFSEVVATKDKESLTRHVSLAIWALFALLMPVVAGSLVTGEGIVTLLLGPDFQGNGRVLSVLLTGLLGQTLVNVFGLSVLTFHRRAVVINCILLAATAGGIPLAYALQLKFGLLGIALATMTTRLVSGTLMMLFARQYLARLPAREFLLTAGPALVMLAALSFAPTFALVPTLIVGGSVYAVVLAALNMGKIRTLTATLRSRLA